MNGPMATPTYNTNSYTPATLRTPAYLSILSAEFDTGLKSDDVSPSFKGSGTASTFP